MYRSNNNYSFFFLKIITITTATDDDFGRCKQNNKSGLKVNIKT